jgi:type III pantothenate kinase
LKFFLILFPFKKKNEKPERGGAAKEATAMLLVVDVGNTNMVFGIYEQDQLVGTFRMMTDTNRTSDEIGLTACQYFQRFQLDTDQVEAVVIASVVPQVMYSLTSAVIKYFDRTPLVVGEDIMPGLTYEVEGSGERLGADRSVACVAALHKYGAPLVGLDFGTATTLDALNAQGAYLGGAISAGVKITMDALFRSAAMLPHVELAQPETVIGTSTVEQMQIGVVSGYIGSMEYLIRRMKEEMPDGEKARVVATGGLARLVADNTDLIDVVDPQLILDGLQLLYQRYLEDVAR